MLGIVTAFRENRLTMTERKSYFIYITAMFVFGSIGLFVRNIPLSSGMMAFSRGFLGSLFIFAFLLCKKQKINWQQIKANFLLLFISGACIGLQWFFLFESFSYTSIANATLSYYFAPVFLMLASPFVMKEPFTIKKIICTVGAVVGMFLVVGTDASGSNMLKGISFGLIAAVLYAFAVLVNKFIKGLGGMETATVQLFFAAMVIAPYAFYSNTVPFSSLSWFSLLLLLWVGLFNTGVCYAMYFAAIQNLKVQTIALNSYIDPVAAIVLSSIFLHETMVPIQILGGILILGSTFLSQWQWNKNVFGKRPSL